MKLFTISKKYLLLVITGVALLSLFSCKDSKSYSDLLREEEVAVNWYLAQHRVEIRVPDDSVFITGEDAPFYRMDASGDVYMRVVNPGDMSNRPKKGDTVYFRFMRQNIKYLYKYGSASEDGNADDMGSSLGGLSLVYGNTVLPNTTRYGTGLQVPLNYLGYNCEVDLIVKSVDGFSEEVSQCNPYIYKSLKYYKAEY